MEVNNWMSNNFFKLNKDKTDILLVGPIREMVYKKLVKLTPCIRPEVTSLVETLDSDLSFNSHVNKVITNIFHLRNTAKIQPFLNQNDEEKLIHAFISSRLDYYNALFTALSQKSINRLHLIQIWQLSY